MLPIFRDRFRINEIQIINEIRVVRLPNRRACELLAGDFVIIPLYCFWRFSDCQLSVILALNPEINRNWKIYIGLPNSVVALPCLWAA
jgi:hypothetical protein